MTAKVFHAELWGKRDGKYNWLAERSVETTDWEQVQPDEPFYLFKPFDKSEVGDYYDWQPINDVMPINGTGVITKRDFLSIDFDQEVLFDRVCTFAKLTEHHAKERLKLPKDVRDWRYAWALADVLESGPSREYVKPILYRAFDSRHIYYTGRTRGFIGWPVERVMGHMLAGENRGIIARRQMVGDGATYFFAASTIISDGVIRSDNRGSESLFPLYLYPGVGKADQSSMFEQWPEGRDGRRPNLDPAFVQTIEQVTGLKFVSDGRGDLAAGGTFGPEDVLAYIYAVFHWPEYRRRYEPMLKLDFPRVPPPPPEGGAERFIAFAKLGHELLAAHLLEDGPASEIAGESIAYPVNGDNRVEKGYPKYVAANAKPVKVGKVKLEAGDASGGGRVYINAQQYFEGVEPAVWEFQIGGYQVCEKWLKDRRGRVLDYDDLTHYPRIAEALRKTMDLMQRIDEAAGV